MIFLFPTDKLPQITIALHQVFVEARGTLKQNREALVQS